MPFDINEAAPDIRRRVLIDALRGKLPEGFEWDFSVVERKAPGCGTAGCAIGLARSLWPGKRLPIWYDRPREPARLANFFGIPVSAVEKIFLTSWHYGENVPMSEITPKMVASKLEKIA